MAKEMLINTVAGQECRIAIVEDGKLEELYVERASNASHVGNIYKGRVINVEPSIQAAFVDFGLSKHGFLHISDVQGQYFPPGRSKYPEQVGSKSPYYHRPPIQECLRRGQEVVVQLTKEGIGTKGPTLTTYLSIPGRLVVMMPGMSRLGISRKVEDEEARDKARQILSKLKLPPDMGFIVRTAGVGQSQRELQRDLSYLMRLWNTVKKGIAESTTPAEVYRESDLVARTMRDVYDTDIDRIVCDDRTTAREVWEFLDLAMPRSKNLIELYVGKQGLFHDYGLEEEMEKTYSRHVELPSGGSLVIDQTEALVAVDVNSGRFRAHSDAETTSLKINQEAAVEVARQLRLRDVGGVIVIDFIDMREAKNRRAVERALRQALKADRAKNKLLRINSLGIMEMTRQRIRPSLKDSIYSHCRYCSGTGLIKSEESQALMVMRILLRSASKDDVARIEVAVTPPVAHHLANYQRKQISQLETATGKTIVIRSDADLTGDEVRVKCTNARGSEVAWEGVALAKAGKRKLETIDVEALSQQKPKPSAGKPAKVPIPAQEPLLPQPPQEAGTEATKTRRRSRRSGRKHIPPTTQPAATAEAKPQAKAPRKRRQAAQLAVSQPVEGQLGQRPIAPQPPQQGDQAQPTVKKARRRGRRGGRKHRKRTVSPPANGQAIS